MLLSETLEGKTGLVPSGHCSRSIYTVLRRPEERSRFLPASSFRTAFLWYWPHLYLERDTVDPCCLIQVSSPSRDERDCRHLVELRSWKHCQEFSTLFFLGLSFLKTQLSAVQQIFPSSIVSHPKIPALILSVLSLKVLLRYYPTGK